MKVGVKVWVREVAGGRGVRGTVIERQTDRQTDKQRQRHKET